MWSVFATVSSRLLSALAHGLRIALLLVEARTRDEIVQVAVVGARVIHSIPRLRSGVSLRNCCINFNDKVASPCPRAGLTTCRLTSTVAPLPSAVQLIVRSSM